MDRETIQQQPFSPSELERYQSYGSYGGHKAAKFGRNKYCLPENFPLDMIRNEMMVYPDDLWIVTPPKCGTTWMQEIVWLLHTEVDLSQAQCNQFYRIPFMELGYILRASAWRDAKTFQRPDFEKTPKNEENAMNYMAHSLEYVQSLTRPRIIKTHLPLELLPSGLLDACKVTNEEIVRS